MTAHMLAAIAIIWLGCLVAFAVVMWYAGGR